MITYLRGEVISVTDKRLVVEVGHVGFQVSISSRDAANMPPVGEEVLVYTYMSVREDAISLYGFLSEDDLEIYKQLITVSGIGPKGGLGILSVMSADDLRMAVLADDSKTIAKAPGIGPKTAKKLILELKDKISAQEMLEHLQEKASDSAASAFEAAKEEAVQIMVALGFSRSEAVRAVRNAKLDETMDADQILTAALHEK